MIYLTTIRQQIHDLNPQKAKQLEQSGQMQEILDEYDEQIVEQGIDAARQARLDNQGQPQELLIQAQEMAVEKANEIALTQIMEELQLLYGTDTTTESQIMTS